MSKLFNPDYLQHLCQKYGLRPSKKYGQNFLIEGEVVEKILAAADISKTDTVVEVGPGFGILTGPLAERAGRVISFEIEKKLQPYWSRQENSFPNLTVVWGNVLKSFESTDYGLQTTEYKVAANVPYQITSPLIRMFLEADNPPTEMILMVQKEVAERICAGPGDMSLLSLSVQLYSKPEIMFGVSRESFWPSPAVDSAVIKLTPRLSGLDPAQISKLFTLAKLGFSSKRKVLLKNIKSLIKPGQDSKILKLLMGFGLTKTARAQELSLQNWLDLSVSL